MKNFLKLLILVGVFYCQPSHAIPYEFYHCFGDYEGWTAPEKVEYRLKRLICDFLEEHPEFTFVHHSDWRAKGALVDYPENFVAVSQHTTGRALDFRLDPYDGFNRNEKLTFHWNGKEYFMDWMKRKGRTCLGFGYYPDTGHPFYHVDTYGCDPGEKRGRRWAVIGGREVGIPYAEDWVLRQLGYE